MPFIRAEVPAVDLISLDYRPFFTGTPDRVDECASGPVRPCTEGSLYISG
jgi:hypothetical protein